MQGGSGCFLVAALLLTSAGSHAGEAQVSVRLVSGRSFTGIFDSRTSNEHLWLRQRVGNTELQRPIAWERIQSAQLDGEPIALSELQKQAVKLATSGRAPQLRDAIADGSPPALVSPRTVHSIRCDAWLANWDADAELDGLMLEVVAFDEYGQTVAAQGTVEAALTTINYQPAYLNSTSGGHVPTSLGQWTQVWNAQQRLRLEMVGRHPQREHRLDRYALLKLRVSIPGSGVFEEQVDGLRMRPFSPVGNQLSR